MNDKFYVDEKGRVYDKDVTRTIKCKFGFSCRYWKEKKCIYFHEEHKEEDNEIKDRDGNMENKLNDHVKNIQKDVKDLKELILEEVDVMLQNQIVELRKIFQNELQCTYNGLIKKLSYFDDNKNDVGNNSTKETNVWPKLCAPNGAENLVVIDDAILTRISNDFYLNNKEKRLFINNQCKHSVITDKIFYGKISQIGNDGFGFIKIENGWDEIYVNKKVIFNRKIGDKVKFRVKMFLRNKKIYNEAVELVDIKEKKYVRKNIVNYGIMNYDTCNNNKKINNNNKKINKDTTNTVKVNSENTGVKESDVVKDVCESSGDEMIDNNNNNNQKEDNNNHKKENNNNNNKKEQKSKDKNNNNNNTINESGGKNYDTDSSNNKEKKSKKELKFDNNNNNNIIKNESGSKKTIKKNNKKRKSGENNDNKKTLEFPQYTDGYISEKDNKEYVKKKKKKYGSKILHCFFCKETITIETWRDGPMCYSCECEREMDGEEIDYKKMNIKIPQQYLDKIELYKKKFNKIRSDQI